MAGHLRQDKMLELIAWDYTWPEMRKFINEYICHGFTGSVLIFGFRLEFLAPCSDHQFFSNQYHSLIIFFVHHSRAIHIAKSSIHHYSIIHHQSTHRYVLIDFGGEQMDEIVLGHIPDTRTAMIALSDMRLILYNVPDAHFEPWKCFRGPGAAFFGTEGQKITLVYTVLKGIVAHWGRLVDHCECRDLLSTNLVSSVPFSWVFLP